MLLNWLVLVKGLKQHRYKYDVKLMIADQSCVIRHRKYTSVCVHKICRHLIKVANLLRLQLFCINTGWPQKTYRNLALNYQTLKLKYIKHVLVSKHSLVRTRKFRLIFHTLTKILSKIMLRVKMQKTMSI